MSDCSMLFDWLQNSAPTLVLDMACPRVLNSRHESHDWPLHVVSCYCSSTERARLTGSREFKVVHNPMSNDFEVSTRPLTFLLRIQAVCKHMDYARYTKPHDTSTTCIMVFNHAWDLIPTHMLSKSSTGNLAIQHLTCNLDMNIICICQCQTGLWVLLCNFN